MFVWESDRKQYLPKLNFTQFLNRNVKILARRFYSPSLKDVAWLEDAQLIFLIFHTWLDRQTGCRSREKNLQTNVWKIEKNSSADL